MAHADMARPEAGEAASKAPRPRSFLTSLESVLGTLVEVPSPTGERRVFYSVRDPEDGVLEHDVTEEKEAALLYLITWAG